MADKSSRALVIYGDGFAPLVTSSHSDLHSFASLSCCGFLSLRDSPPSGTIFDRFISIEFRTAIAHPIANSLF